MSKHQSKTPLAQNIVNWLYPITILGLFTITIEAPLLAALLFLKISWLKVILVWLFLLPVGPVATAVIAVAGHFLHTQTPGLYVDAWRFLRQNGSEALRLWLPTWLFCLPLWAYSQGVLDERAPWLYVLIPLLFVIALVLLLLQTAVWMINANFTFQYRDYWRLAIGGFAANKLTLFANLLLVFIGFAIGAWFSPLLLIVLSTCLFVPMVALDQPLLAWVKANFIKP
ncbi:hypothetical protein [Lacticaseibacillus porcinae]|uniref:hypothetical protein n=1 Tax=Lacticaseibacillus porcinae TaxID=1123687 RepID=UPI000F7B4CA6|nr:hypothetical protein [Lacticaseibacillus porcinae]